MRGTWREEPRPLRPNQGRAARVGAVIIARVELTQPMAAQLLLPARTEALEAASREEYDTRWIARICLEETGECAGAFCV